MKNTFKKAFSVLIAFVIAFSITTGTGGSLLSGDMNSQYAIVANAASKKVALSATKITLYVGKTKALNVKNTKKKVTWSTKNKKVATVNAKGVVTAKGAGTTYIYAKVSGKIYKCKVTVLKTEISAKTKTLYCGGTFTLKIKNAPGKITWSTQNKKVATVNSKGVVTAKGAGTTYIQAKVGGKTYKCKITVLKTEISKASSTLYYKETTTLKVNNAPSKVTWSSGDTNIATVNSKGVVTACGVGSTYIYAKVSIGTYKSKITVKDRDQAVNISIATNDGGFFVKGENSANISFDVNEYDAAQANVYIQDASENIVYEKTFNNLVKNNAYSFEWDGKDSNGAYVSGGTYYVFVEVGSTKTQSSEFKFIKTNDFSDGSGSETNPFAVETVSEFEKIVKYPTAHFIQTKDLDFEYEAVGGLFSQDQQFNGIYDGAGKTISNIAATEALFKYVGANGVIKNLKMTSCSVVGDDQALLVKYNYGKVQNCNVGGTVTATVRSSNRSGSANAGLMIYYNYGTVSNCETYGNVTATGQNGDHAHAGGIAEFNGQTGKIISCVSHTNAKSWSDNRDTLAGGIVAINDGMINGCEADGTIEATGRSLWKVGPGGIAGTNNSQIIDCYYTGSSDVNIAGINSGTIV